MSGGNQQPIGPLRAILLDRGLEARLTFAGDVEENPTVVVLPGLGVRPGEQERKARRALRRALGMGIHLNIATFLYPSHRSDPLSGFGRDPEGLGSVLEVLRVTGIRGDRLGFFAICYGVNVLCRYRELGDAGRFAVLIEPLLGYGGFRRWFRLVARSTLFGLDSFGRSWTWGRRSRVDPGSLHRVLVSPARLDDLAMPFLAISNRRHMRIFDQRKLEAQLRGTEGRHAEIDGKRFSKRSVQEYYRVVADALLGWVARTRGG